MSEELTKPPATVAVLTVLGLESIVDVEAVSWNLATPESRHGIWRLGLPPDIPGPESYVVKCYRRSSDRFFDHRFRREERALDLLGRHVPGITPTLLGGSITAGHSAFLVIEDLGDSTLHVELETSPVASRKALMLRAMDALTALHREMDRHSALFRSLCYSSDLDRVNSTTMMERFEIAVGRCAGSSDGTPVVRSRTKAQFRREVVTPLLKSRRRVIHNSFSPLNICVNGGGHTRIVDLETLSIGPAELDIAELISYPGVDLGSDENILVERYTNNSFGDFDRAAFGERIQLAAVARCTDYAGTLTMRQMKFRDEGHADLALVQAHRRSLYVEEAVRRAMRAKLSGELVRFLHSLAGEPSEVA